MRSYADLLVWQKAMDLVTAVYRLTDSFPSNDYMLMRELRKSAISIPSNIAEGHSLSQTLAYLRHLAIARGSLAELETQLEIARRLAYINSEWGGAKPACAEVGRMLTGLRRSLRARTHERDH